MAAHSERSVRDGAEPPAAGVSLPSPGVQFAPGFAARVGRLSARLSAARNRREGAGRSRLFGVGAEFVGFRPYRPGEDLRQLDWSLYARTRKPFVRIARREASEAWAILLDTSASMGVGRPGKLQLGAEVAAGLVALAQRVGASVTLLAGGGQLRVGPRTPLAPVLAFLERLLARGGSEQAGDADAQLTRSMGRVILIGDLLDRAPRDVLGLRRPGRELQVIQILAREELDPGVRADGALPGPGDAVEWIEPETGERRTLVLEPETIAAYDARLSVLLEDWGQTLQRHRIPYGVWSSSSDFEDVLGAGRYEV